MEVYLCFGGRLFATLEEPPEEEHQTRCLSLILYFTLNQL